MNTFEYAQCCEVTKEWRCIFISSSDNKFYLDGIGRYKHVNIEYCPWCGKLLDTNLLDEEP